ncbi:MAG: hypothetical protein AAF629_03285 [Chloroflexota bacterium]
MKFPYPIFLVILCGLFAFNWSFQAPISHAAQPATPTLRPTATNISSSSSDDDSDDTPIVAPAGSIRGFVYNFSAGGAPEAGITVVLDGGGWQVETMTDSNGFYQFSGLGASQAVLNLRLPSGTTPLMKDWPVFTGNPIYEDVNLGFYWGDTSPMPVTLSVTPDNVRVPINQRVPLQFKINNRSGGIASNSRVDIQLPNNLTVQNVTSTQGEIDSSGQRIWVDLGTVVDQSTVNITLQARFTQSVLPQEGTIRTTFTYDEAPVPQVLLPSYVALEAQISATATPTPVPAEESNDEASNNEASEGEQAARNEDDEASTATPEPEPETANTTSDDPPTTSTPVPEAEGQMDTPEDDASGDDDATTSEASDETPSETDQVVPQSESLIPETGGAQLSQGQELPWSRLGLAIFLLASTGFAGIRAYIKRGV